MQVFILFFFIFPRSMSITPNAIRVTLCLCPLPRMLFGSPSVYVYYPECYSGHPLSMSITPNAIRVPPVLCLLPRMLFGYPLSYVYYPECYSGIPVLAGMPLSQKKFTKSSSFLAQSKIFHYLCTAKQSAGDINYQ